MPPPPPRVPSNPTTSSNPFSKSAPFKPPGPARTSNKPSTSTSTSTPTSTKAPAALSLLSSPSSQDSDFGTAFSLSDVETTNLANSPPLLPSVSRPAPAKPPPTTTTSKSRPADLSAARDRPAPAAQEDENGIPGLPPQLLTRIMHEAYRDKGTRISKEGNEVMGRYVDIFIREAMARAAEGKREKGVGGEEDVWVDVEDLEAVVPGLVLDF
ncbi:Epsin-1 [Sphaceloma murrayae]|uniref:Epsin-1 n=1 Tax=Sphaceloma murrayae TaxID=2082308 RepID=A0A2K1QT56_9PEZI|nr:Epsin-1 [Sphaceloma murrayae]